jgi:hypothetical protein
MKHKNTLQNPTLIRNTTKIHWPGSTNWNTSFNYRNIVVINKEIFYLPVWLETGRQGALQLSPVLKTLHYFPPF